MSASTVQEWRLDFTGKTCVVTGAGGGIGQGIAVAFAQAGAKVAILERNRQGAEETAAKIGAFGGQAVGIACDVADEASVKTAAQAVRDAFGDAEILVNNAGVIRFGRLETLALDQWDQMIAVNLRGYLLCAQEFARPMLAKGAGAIVHIASIAASEPHHYCGAYSASKAAVVMLSQQMALEWGPSGVRSNCVSPGLVRTPLAEDFYAQPGVTEQRTAAVPLRRIGAPQDIADAALFLASDRASYVTGANLVVDGGVSQTSMLQIPRPGVA